MATFEKELAVTKTDNYSITVDSSWLEGEAITSHNVTVGPEVTKNSSGIIGDSVYVSLTGVTAGSAVIHFDYGTASGRTDCIKTTVRVTADC